jgi:hypothetical protein
LVNGDRITGVIKELANGVYTIETAGGLLKIEQKQVANISQLPEQPAAAGPDTGTPETGTAPTAASEQEKPKEGSPDAATPGEDTEEPAKD